MDSAIYGIIFLVLIGLIIIGLILIGGGIYSWTVDLEYQREIEVYFTYADRSADAVSKAQYFNQFVEALEKHELTTGSTSVFFKEQPNASVEKNFGVAKSLQSRLNELAKLDPSEEAYQYGMRQVTLQEFCWFPTEAFTQAYLLKHGAWGWALVPPDTEDRCYGDSD